MIYFIEYYNEYNVDGEYLSDYTVDDIYFNSDEDAEEYLIYNGYVKVEHELIPNNHVYEKPNFNITASIEKMELFNKDIHMKEEWL